VADPTNTTFIIMAGEEKALLNDELGTPIRFFHTSAPLVVFRE
jgi:hypothetical protein